ncbi:MAG TPA: hypothetical protein VNJ09_09335 [Chthonomonadales bacterium]|nr:hypothetical protein [Chthonomonadales bacterium]
MVTRLHSRLHSDAEALGLASAVIFRDLLRHRGSAPNLLGAGLFIARKYFQVQPGVGGSS